MPSCWTFPTSLREATLRALSFFKAQSRALVTSPRGPAARSLRVPRCPILAAGAGALPPPGTAGPPGARGRGGARGWRAERGRCGPAATAVRERIPCGPGWAGQGSAAGGAGRHRGLCSRPARGRARPRLRGRGAGGSAPVERARGGGGRIARVQPARARGARSERGREAGSARWARAAHGASRPERRSAVGSHGAAIGGAKAASAGPALPGAHR